MFRVSRSVWMLFFGAAVIAWLITVTVPVNNTWLRIQALGLGGLMWLGLVFLTWKIKTVRWLVLFVSGLAALLFLTPGRTLDRGLLRELYLTELRKCEDTEYIWGGESRREIDCSGLPRRALQQALVQYGLRRFDGGAVREAAEQWWFDTSAAAMGQGYRGFTVPVGQEFQIDQIEDHALQPGDLAVTLSGIHVLVYLGEGRWIQADPALGHVATLHGKQDKNSYFTTRVRPHRWAVLMDSL